jgi:hypothetical protein
MAGPWVSLTNTPSFSLDTMLLLTDGTVVCHEKAERLSTGSVRPESGAASLY